MWNYGAVGLLYRSQISCYSYYLSPTFLLTRISDIDSRVVNIVKIAL